MTQINPSCPRLVEAKRLAPNQPNVSGDALQEFSGYYPSVFGYAYSILCDPLAADEVALRVMLRACKGMDVTESSARDELVFGWAEEEIEACAERRSFPASSGWLPGPRCCPYESPCPLSGPRKSSGERSSDRALHRWAWTGIVQLAPATADRVVARAGHGHSRRRIALGLRARFRRMLRRRR